MADTATTITIFHQSGRNPKDISDQLIRDTSERSMSVQKCAQLLDRIAGGVEGGTVAVRVDSYTGIAASGSFTCVQASCTAGDTLLFLVPGYATPFVLTGVASTAGTAQYSIDTSDTAVAASVKAGINALAGLRDIIVADSSSGTVTWIAKKVGENGNNIEVRDVSTNAAAHVVTAASGGLNITKKPAIAIVFGSANITAGDTLSVGGRKYTWAASASADGEITLSTTEATAATNFAAAINADATWTGLITATRDTATVTLTWEGDPRMGKHIVVTVAETNAGSVAPGGTVMITNAESFLLSTTVTGYSATKRYVLGGHS